jgi:hypothetical protein
MIEYSLMECSFNCDLFMSSDMRGSTCWRSSCKKMQTFLAERFALIYTTPTSKYSCRNTLLKMIHSVWTSSPLALMVAVLAATVPATARTAPIPTQPAPASTPGPAGPELQLETPRRTQQTQRQDFPLVNEESSFVFNFAQDVRTCLLSDLDGHLVLCNTIWLYNTMHVQIFETRRSD